MPVPVTQCSVSGVVHEVGFAITQIKDVLYQSPFPVVDCHSVELRALLHIFHDAERVGGGQDVDRMRRYRK